MSYQTKEQAVGYLFFSFLDAGVNRDELVKVYYITTDIIEEGYTKITNHDTHRVLTELIERMDIGEERAEELRSALHWAFNDNTVEVAGEMYKRFKPIILKDF